MNENKSKEIVNILMALLGGAFMAIALKIFVNQAAIVPAGFSGIAVLIQRISEKFFNINIPFAPINLCLNFFPAILAWKMIGKKYTLTSFIIIFEVSILTDFIPKISLTEDILILAVFGAIFNAFGASLVYIAGTSTGGTDFISMSISNKYHISTFKYVMIFNIILILIQGVLFGFSTSFYSIIFQYVNTQVINMRYKHYEKRTLLIISDKADEIAKEIISNTSHSVTKIMGEGCYTHDKRNILYTITTSPELRKTISIVRTVDEKAFVNVMDSKEVSGNFNYLPVDMPENKVSS